MACQKANMEESYQTLYTEFDILNQVWVQLLSNESKPVIMAMVSDMSE